MRWRFRLTGRPSYGGSFASTPVADDDTVYVQDLSSNVFALDLENGKPRWEHRFRARNDGPNGGAYPGPVPYTDSLLVLDAPTGKLLWHDQVTPHDVRDYDFEATPIVAGDSVIGAGKAGRVVAWDRKTRRRLWEQPVGLHRNDLGPLPRHTVSVCPAVSRRRWPTPTAACSCPSSTYASARAG